MDHRHGAAGVYRRHGVLLVISESFLGCGGGGSVLNGWVFAGSAAIGDEALGQAVRNAWAASECNVPMPDFSRPIPALQKVLAAVGATSERQLARGNVLLEVRLKRDAVELLPTRNDGTGGFAHRPELAEEIDAMVDSVVLGRRIREALARCR